VILRSEFPLKSEKFHAMANPRIDPARFLHEHRYLLGVSTRRMDKLVESLGITRLSKSQVSVMAATSTNTSPRSAPDRWMRARTRSSPPTRWC
jgi:hypothetical protein